ncbi:MAG: hypothetical protein AAGA60_10535 [Cyanobacteria bacterium P01_E01_bin.42]
MRDIPCQIFSPYEKGDRARNAIAMPMILSGGRHNLTDTCAGQLIKG